MADQIKPFVQAPIEGILHRPLLQRMGPGSAIMHRDAELRSQCNARRQAGAAMIAAYLGHYNDYSFSNGARALGELPHSRKAASAIAMRP